MRQALAAAQPPHPMLPPSAGRTRTKNHWAAALENQIRVKASPNHCPWQQKILRILGSFWRKPCVSRRHQRRYDKNHFDNNLLTGQNSNSLVRYPVHWFGLIQLLDDRT